MNENASFTEDHKKTRTSTESGIFYLTYLDLWHVSQAPLEYVATRGDKLQPVSVSRLLLEC